MPDQPHVVILGAGFGGIGALKSLGDASAYLFVTANLPRRVPRRSIVAVPFHWVIPKKQFGCYT
jgi:hypothetical protein